MAELPEKCRTGFMFLLFFPLVYLASAQNSLNGSREVKVGVVLDFGSVLGKISDTCISMSLGDFYATHNHYTTRLILYRRDSHKNVVGAAAAALDLVNKEEAQAIIGPQSSEQSKFVINIGNKSQVPIISFSATSPSLSSDRTPYFVRTAQNDSSQVKAITAIVQAFKWRQVVVIYEDSECGMGVVPYLIDALQEIEVGVSFRSALHPSSSDSLISQELNRLKQKQTRVFIVHMTSSVASRFFLKAKEAEMMTKEYAWIITDGMTNLLDCMDSSVIDSMQGVLGVKPYVQPSKTLHDFKKRWQQRFQREHPEMERASLSLSGLWAYDTVTALALAAEKISGSIAGSSDSTQPTKNSTSLTSLPVSSFGPKLLQAILNTKFTGLSGDFKLVEREMQQTYFEIVNVVGGGERVIGYWTPAAGLSRNLTEQSLEKSYSASSSDLDEHNIIWPGESKVVPKGWEIPTNGGRLKVGVPVTRGLRKYVKGLRDPITNKPNFTGFSVDVFEVVMKHLPYKLDYDLVLFENSTGGANGTYDDLVYQVYLGNYDAVLADLTIIANRSRYVDFTLPYTESGVSMLVAVKDDKGKRPWVFLKPLTWGLWVTSGAFFVITGFVVWILEHGTNSDFSGSLPQQLATSLWFAFSTMVFAHKEKISSNLSRIVVIIWLFVVLILTTSYTASLTSMLTVQQLQPTFSDIDSLIKSEDYVGYTGSSFVGGLLERLNFNSSKFKRYVNPEEYAPALTKGSKNDGVAAIFDEIPYIRHYLPTYCGKLTMVGPTYKTGGFGFAFPKGSPLASDFSRVLLNVTEGVISELEKHWFGEQTTCLDPDGALTSTSLTLESFKGLFIITGTASAAALIIHLFFFFHKHINDLNTPGAGNLSFLQRIVATAGLFIRPEFQNEKSEPSRQISAISIRAIAPYSDDSAGGGSPLSVSGHLQENITPVEGATSIEEGNTPETNTHENNIC